MMAEDNFKALVKQMRDAQKEYFRTRTHDSLQRSKALESRVDAELVSGKPIQMGDVTLLPNGKKLVQTSMFNC